MLKTTNQNKLSWEPDYNRHCRHRHHCPIVVNAVVIVIINNNHGPSPLTIIDQLLIVLSFNSWLQSWSSTSWSFTVSILLHLPATNRQSMRPRQLLTINQGSAGAQHPRLAPRRLHIHPAISSSPSSVKVDHPLDHSLFNSSPVQNLMI